ncbi:MAG: sigma-54 interaction domain-containing protein [Chitinophagales bacterium]
MQDIQAIKRRFGIIGNSRGLNNALQTAMQVAPTDLSILVLGESGVGKEVFSHVIHSLSKRKHNDFIAVNCGAIPSGTIDSELFGHEKGAFTGASDNRKGYFETVNGGTIFLDEVGEMPMETQKRLLRVLESGEFIKVGSSKAHKTDVRVIAATNVDLMEAVRRGRFREDLYYRLNTVPIQIPPLRERKEDIYQLFRKFTVDFSEHNRISPIKLTDEAKEVLIDYRWRGNIRELKNIAEQITVLSPERLIDADELIRFLPTNPRSNTKFPVLSGRGGYGSDDGGYNNMSEREMFYKVILQMQQDIQDLKRLMIQLVRNNGGMPSSAGMLPAKMDNYEPHTPYTSSPSAPMSYPTIKETNSIVVKKFDHPYSSNVNPTDDYNPAEVVEESLKIEEMERELIEKALKKHRGKRKDAATDLGISERTLYRKIKEYNIKN